MIAFPDAKKLLAKKESSEEQKKELKTYIQDLQTCNKRHETAIAFSRLQLSGLKELMLGRDGLADLTSTIQEPVGLRPVFELPPGKEMIRSESTSEEILAWLPDYYSLPVPIHLLPGRVVSLLERPPLKYQVVKSTWGYRKARGQK